MALDTATQKTSVYKSLFLKKVKYAIMTGDSIAVAFSTEVNTSNYLYRSDANQYLFNQAVAGSNIANFSGGDSETWNPLSFVGRSAVDAVNVFDVTNADVLLVWGSFNDKGDNIPLGSPGSVDPLTFEGAIRTGVANYAARKSNLQLMFITPNANPYETANSLGLLLTDYRQRMIDVCAALGIPCFDLYPVCGITDENKATALPDQIHPTAAFHQMWAPLFADFVLENI